jgi:hypothetical protein
VGGRGAEPRWLVATLAFAGYFLAARGVGNLYPLSTFPMYSGAPAAALSRVMARTAAGEFLEVTDLVAWRCETLPRLEDVACADARGIAYVDREREDHIRAHAGAGAEPVELVRRVFSFDGAARPAACVISRCAATRARR